MSPRPEGENVGVRNGRWGEQIAAEQLRIEGLTVIERNVRPCPDDRRIEIDIVAYDRKQDVLVFVEVKQHKSISMRQRRLRSITRRKLDLLRRGCRTWLKRNRWEGSHRFDVIEVYGEPGAEARTEVDHIRHVRLFARQDRFVNWEE